MTAPARTGTGIESARRVSDCVAALLRDQPFFGSLALRLPIRADAGRETLASDGQEIRYAPQWVADTDADLIKTALGRVVLACALKCQRRRKNVPARRRKNVLRAGWELVPVVHGRDPRAGRRALRAAGGGPRVGGACGPTRASRGLFGRLPAS